MQNLDRLVILLFDPSIRYQCDAGEVELASLLNFDIFRMTPRDISDFL